MSTLYYNDAIFLQHVTAEGHPESAARLTAIETALHAPEFDVLRRLNAPNRNDTEANIGLIHKKTLVKKVLSSAPKQGFTILDGGDTALSPTSLNAVFGAVNAICDAVDKVCTSEASNAFCALRPPGHHAMPEEVMGFCLFNHVAIAAEYARVHHHINKVAIVDFDVHHGNGTQAAFEKNSQVFYASSHEMPAFPYTGYPQETGVGNIVNVPLYSGERGESVRKKYTEIIFPALRAFNPDLVLISAGFDAHKDDPLASVMLVEDDYRWLTEQLLTIAAEYCNGRVISSLEGGYNLEALAASVAVHVRSLMHA